MAGKPPTQWGIVVDATEVVTVTREPAEGDQWDNGETHTDRTVHGIRLAGPTDNRDLVVRGPLVVGRTYWLLYTEWGSGCSFGFDDNCHVTYHELYDSEAKARRALARLEKPYRKADNKRRWFNDYRIGTNEGELMNVHPSWEGYFDSLTGHRVESFVLKDKS